MIKIRALVSALLLLACCNATAQVRRSYWEDFLRPYDDDLLYVHSLVNYAYDLEWRYEWERRQLADNGVRISTGSVSADDLLDDMDININQALNDRWHFLGRYSRLGVRQRAGKRDQLMLGLERSVFDSSAVFLLVNPQYQKEFMDLAIGYARYSENRERYARFGIFFEDFAFGTKNREGIKEVRKQAALQWQLRSSLPGSWVLYSEGEVGNGFDRTYTREAESAPGVSHHERRENSAELRLSHVDAAGQVGWSAWVQWYDFREAIQYRSPEFDYLYTDTIANVSAEHFRVVGDRHRWRFLLHYIDQRASSRGYDAHDYDRNEFIAGVFYEYLWTNNGISIGYAGTAPNMLFVRQESGVVFDVDNYSDKAIASWHHGFSDSARLRVAFSHEIVNKGFGGASIQFQTLF